MRVAVILGALGPMAGCLFDPTVPIDATLACAIDADCPADAVCVVGRCSPVEALRTPAPVVTDVAISPSLVGRGGRVEVSFAIDGALQAAPIVEGDVGRPVRLDPIAGGDGRFRFSYTVDGTESPGEAGLTAFLVDALGRSTTATLGSFSLDLQAPTLAEPTLARGSVGRGSAIIVEAVLDEPAAIEARIDFVDATSVPLDIGGDGLRVVATVVVDDRFRNGQRGDVVLRARDLAGNDSGDVVVGEVVIDLTTPTLSLQPLPPTVRPRDFVRFIVGSDEVVAAPTLTVDGAGTPQTLVPDVAAGATISWSWIVPDPGSDVDVTFSPGNFVDAADNSAVLAPWTLRIDRTAPTLVIDEPLSAQVRAGERIAARFSFSEPVTVDRVELFRFDEVIVADVAGAGTGPYTIAVPADDLAAEGRYDAVVTAVDGAGNESRVTLGSVVVDARAPALLDVGFTPPEARLGSTVTLQLTFSESIAVDETGALPGLVANTPLFFVGQSGTTFTYALLVTPFTPSPVEVVSLAVSDLAGNNAVVDTSPVARLIVDNRAPVLRGVAPVAVRVPRRTGSVIAVTGTVEDDGATAAVSASFEGRAAACTVESAGALRCELPVTDDDSDGVHAISVNAVDLAGNRTSASVLVTLDGEAPLALATAFGQETVRPEGVVQLNLLADETLAEVELALSTGTTTVTPGSSTLRLPLRAPATGAMTLASARLVDDLGNTRTIDFSPPLRVDVDGIGPAIVGSALSTNDRVAMAARVGDTIVVEADIELPLLDAPSFRFGATPMTITLDDGSGHFEATHVISADDVEGAIVVGVTAADPLGNIAFARLDPPIVVDRTPPTLIPDTARLAIQPPPGAPVVAPTAVGAGGQATFSWVVSEATVGPPRFFVDAGAVIPVSLISNRTSFSARFPGDAFSSGRHTLLVEQEDEVGNVGAIELGAFDVDLEPPLPLLVEELASLVHVRAPHGSVDSAVPFHQVEARSPLPARAGQTLSVAFDDGDQLRLATGVLGGALTLPLGRDFERIFLQVYDEAGNVSSERGATPRTELVAGLNGRVIGQNASNPHCIALRRQHTGLPDDPSAEELNGLVVALRDSVVLTAQAEGRWQDSGPRPPPAAREAVASTTHRGSVHLFGGCTADGPSDEGWAFDGRAWLPLVSAAGVQPPARCGAALASNGELLFLFGGEGELGLLGDLWAWDGFNWRILSDGAGAGPGPRRGMAFGATTDGTLMVYGGFASTGVDGELWVSTDRERWTLRATGPATAGAAFGMLEQVLPQEGLVVVGGVDDGDQSRSSVLLIGVDGIVSDFNLARPVTGACALPFEGQLLVVGGSVDVPLVVDGNSGASTALPSPPAFVAGGCGAFDGRPVVFGGRAPGDELRDTTAMLFDDWQVVGLADLPSARRHAATAPLQTGRASPGGFSPTPGAVEGLRVFGGDANGAPSGEVWEFRNRWTLLTTRLPAIARGGATCIGDTCLIIGGEDANGLRTTAIRWRSEKDEINEIGAGLSPRTSPAVALDDSQSVVLFGGATAAGNSLDTCVLDEVRADPLRWSCRVLPGPTSSAGAVMATTPAGVALWTAGALWRLERDAWVEQVGSGPSPPARQFPVLAFGNDRIWLHGGQAGSTLLGDLWSWDGAAWREHDPADPFGAGEPGPRAAHAGFFDAALNRLVLFSGDQQPVAVADTWDFLPGDNERAGLVIDVDLAAARDFRQLSVAPSGSGSFFVDGSKAGGSGTTSPDAPLVITLLDGLTTAQVAILPATPGALLVVDAVDLRLVRP